MKKVLWVLGIFLVVITVFACSPKKTTLEKPSPADTPSQPQPIAKEAWQVEWDKVVQGAKREGKVVLYAGDLNGEMRDKLADAFFKEYGITAEITL